MLHGSRIHLSTQRIPKVAETINNDAVAGAASEAFTRWLHYRQVRAKLPSTMEHVVSPSDTLCSTSDDLSRGFCTARCKHWAYYAVKPYKLGYVAYNLHL